MSSDLPDTRTEANESTPMRVGQFRVSTILSWTAVICFLMSTLRADLILSSVDRNLDANFVFGVLLFAVFFGPAFTCIPYLIDQLMLKNHGLVFSLFWRIWLSLCLGVYSMLMLILATNAFSPDWRGSKGTHWFYYTLDGRAGVTFWPIYLLGVTLFIAAIFNPEKTKRNSLFLVGCATCAVISFWYTFAALFLNFTNDGSDPKIFAIVPGSVGVGYALYCAIILRNREFAWHDFNTKRNLLIAWFVGLFLSIVAKYPLAAEIYDRLPDEPPENCFVVTAATRGHRNVVGSWYDNEQHRLLNQQLLTFWRFENRLQTSLPNLHRIIRKVYNRVGPTLARMIVFRFQADLVYLLLKPAEFVARTFPQPRR